MVSYFQVFSASCRSIDTASSSTLQGSLTFTVSRRRVSSRSVTTGTDYTLPRAPGRFARKNAPYSVHGVPQENACGGKHHDERRRGRVHRHPPTADVADHRPRKYHGTNKCGDKPGGQVNARRAERHHGETG